MKYKPVMVFAILITPVIIFLIKQSTAQQNDELVFDGGFETEDASQWEELHCDTARQFSIVSSPVREGKYAAKLTVYDNDKYKDLSGERCDLLRPDRDEYEGNEFWYAWSTYFPTGWQAPKDWFVIADWHSRYPDVCQLLQIEVTTNNALIAKVLTGDVSNYQCFDGSGTAFATERFITSKLELDTWNDFIIHVKWTTSDTGIIEIFFKKGDTDKFQKVVNLSGIPTLQYQQDINSPLPPFFILAHYRSDENIHTSTLFHDGFRQGKTQQSVASGDLYRLAKD